MTTISFLSFDMRHQRAKYLNVAEYGTIRLNMDNNYGTLFGNVGFIEHLGSLYATVNLKTTKIHQKLLFSQNLHFTVEILCQIHKTRKLLHDIFM